MLSDLLKAIINVYSPISKKHLKAAKSKQPQTR